VEAYHAATVRTVLYERGGADDANAISGARDSLNGNPGLDQPAADPAAAHCADVATGAVRIHLRPPADSPPPLRSENAAKVGASDEIAIDGRTRSADLTQT